MLENLISVLIWALLALIWPTRFLLEVSALLDIVSSSNPMQYQGNLMMQTGGNGKKSKFWVQFWVPKNVFGALPLLVVKHCSKLSNYVISRKSNKPNLRKYQKPNFRPAFGPLGPNLEFPNFVFWVLTLLDFKHCCKLSSYAISRKTYDLNSRKQWRTSFWAWFWSIVPKFKPTIFFQKSSFISH